MMIPGASSFKLSRDVMIGSFIIVIINGIALLILHKTDSNKDIERFYHSNEPVKYYLWKFAYTVLWVSFAYNARYIMTNLVKFGYQKAMTNLFKQIKRRI
jgi:hypothetical protein